MFSRTRFNSKTFPSPLELVRCALRLRSDKKFIDFFKKRVFKKQNTNGTYRRFYQMIPDKWSLLRKWTRRRKNLMFCAAGASLFDWNKNRIPLEEIEAHKDDFDYVQILKENTICLSCDPTRRNSDASQSSEGSATTICKCGRPQPDSSRSYEGWMPFIEKDDLVVWRRPHESGQSEYKVFGSYNDIAAEDFLQVQIDTDYRKIWDTTAVALDIGETDPDPKGNGDILYWEMQWPRLFVNRDYVFKRRYHIDHSSKTLYIMSKSTEYPSFPKYPDKFRIENYWSCMVIRPYTEASKPGLEFCLTYFDDPGVNIPATVQTWVAMKAMPDFLDKLRNATRGYRNYCLAEGRSVNCMKIRAEEEKKMEEKLDYCSYERRRSEENLGHPTFWKYFHPMYYFS